MKMPFSGRIIRVRDILRDFIVSMIPLQRLPSSWLKKLYGFEPDFFFLIHPRDMNDIYQSMPIVQKARRWLPEWLLVRLLSLSPCYAIADIGSKQGLRGLVISTTQLPIVLFSNPKRARAILARAFNFMRKLVSRKCYVALGGWWPIATDSGRECRQLLDENDRIQVTSGHCATIVSLYWTIKQISEIGGISLSEIDVLIVGVGRMGGGLARYLNGKIRRIGLMDRNLNRAKEVEENLMATSSRSIIERLPVVDDTFISTLRNHARTYRIIICTTSNYGFLVKETEIPGNCIIIDDSRPEAFPRILDLQRHIAVIEGGLIRIDGIQVSRDFGFGETDDVFGCLAEAFLLTLDSGNKLPPSIGEVDQKELNQMLEFCRTHGISEGLLRSGHRIVSKQTIKQILNSRHEEDLPGIEKARAASLLKRENGNGFSIK